MKIAAAVLAGLVLAVIAAVLIVPGAIDWNERTPEFVQLVKDKIVKLAKDNTGRHLELRGDIAVSVLPTPTLRVDDVRVANVEGAASADMVALKSLDVRVALLPLLGGNVQVESVRLEEPTIDIQIFADGRTNLVFSPPEAAASAPGDTGDRRADTPPGPAARPSVVVDDFVIEKGTVIFRDDNSGRTELIENINGRLNAASLTGPLETTGSLIARGIPLSYKVSLGALIRGRTAPISADVRIVPGDMRTRMSGTLAGLPTEPRFKGKITVGGANLTRFAAALGGGARLPEILSRRFALKADVAAAADAVSVSELDLSLDRIRGRGAIDITFGESIDANAALTVNRLDVESLLKPATSAAAERNSAAQAHGAARVSREIAPPRRRAPGTIPENINASVNLTVGTIGYRDGVVREAKFDAALSAGEITVNQVSAQLPGGSDFAMFGFAALKDGVPAFDGNVDMSTNDLRALLTWLGVAPPAAAADRLRKLAFAGKIGATPKEIRLSEINLLVDNTRVKGGAILALRKKLAVGANLVVDKINVDPYLGGPGSAANPPKAGAGDAAAGAPAAPSPANPLAPLAALSSIDANVRARIGALTVQRIPIRDLRLDATVFDGVLTVRDLRIADAAGVTANAKGAVTGLEAGRPAPNPKLRDLTLDVRSRDLSRILKLTETRLPIPPSRLGAVSLSGTLNGVPADLDVDMTLKAARGAAELSGRVAALGDVPAVDAAVRVVHSDLRRFLRLAGVPYAPSGRLGKIDLSAKVAGNPTDISISGLKGVAADIPVSGAVGVKLSGPRPALAMDLRTGAVNIDRFLPAQRRSSLSPTDVRPIRPAAFRIPENFDPRQLLVRIATGGGRFSADAIDLSALGLADADITLKSESLTFGKYTLSGVDLAASLKNGVLNTNRLTGRIFGGALTAGGRIAGAGRSGKYAARLDLRNLGLPAAMRALGSPALKAGRLTFAADLTSTGGSAADIVAGLAGEGRFELRGIDPAGAGRGSLLAPVIGILQPFNALGGRPGGGLADVASTFQVARGVASFDDLKLSSGAGSGSARGSIDLPNWRVRTSGEVRLDRNLLGALLSRQTRLPPVVPFEITGRLDSPNVKLKIGGTGTGGIAIPGLDKLKKKNPGVGAVVDQLLPGILGGTRQTGEPQPSTEPTPLEPGPQQPPQQQRNRQPRADDVLKEFLRGLGR